MQIFVAPGRQMVHQVPQVQREGPGIENGFLSFTQFGSRHQFHGLGDLLGIFDASNASLDIF
jgi:hypothetical protein